MAFEPLRLFHNSIDVRLLSVMCKIFSSISRQFLRVCGLRIRGETPKKKKRKDIRLKLFN